MFGRNRIEELKTRLRDTENCYDKVRATRDTYYKNWMEDAKRIKRVSDERDDLYTQSVSLQEQLKKLELARNQQNTINQALADENQDLSARYSLLEQVLKQLQIPVKLGRKK